MASPKVSSVVFTVPPIVFRSDESFPTLPVGTLLTGGSAAITADGIEGVSFSPAYIDDEGTRTPPIFAKTEGRPSLASLREFQIDLFVKTWTDIGVVRFWGGGPEIEADWETLEANVTISEYGNLFRQREFKIAQKDGQWFATWWTRVGIDDAATYYAEFSAKPTVDQIAIAYQSYLNWLYGQSDLENKTISLCDGEPRI